MPAIKKTEPAEEPKGPSPFDNLEEARVSDESSLTINHDVYGIDLSKPGSQEWFQVHPDPEYTLTTYVLEVKPSKGEKKLYYVLPQLRDAVKEVNPLKKVRLVTIITTDGVVKLWPITVPDSELDSFQELASSAVKVSERAKQNWTKLKWNKKSFLYESDWADDGGALGKPEFPDKPFSELLALAFGERIINSADHPVLQRLRGAAR